MLADELPNAVASAAIELLTAALASTLCLVSPEAEEAAAIRERASSAATAIVEQVRVSEAEASSIAPETSPISPPNESAPAR